MLTGSSLYYYADQHSADAKGVLELQGTQATEAVVDRGEDASGGEYFQVGCAPIMDRDRRRTR